MRSKRNSGITVKPDLYYNIRNRQSWKAELVPYTLASLQVPQKRFAASIITKALPVARTAIHRLPSTLRQTSISLLYRCLPTRAHHSPTLAHHRGLRIAPLDGSDLKTSLTYLLTALLTLQRLKHSNLWQMIRAAGSSPSHLHWLI